MVLKKENYNDQKYQLKLNKETHHLLIKENSLATKKEALQIIDSLKEVIRYNDYRYYVLNDPIISDYEYDKLFGLLKRIEAGYPDLITPDSPTQRIPGEVSKDLPKIKHLTPMLSLDNSYNENDLIDFDKRVKSHLKSTNVFYAIEPKFDGTGISLIYEDDLFVRGSTRGDGMEGEDITTNLKLLRSIPISAAFSNYGITKIEIRGEVLIKKDNLKEINIQRQKAQLSLFANPRNAAAGSLRLQDPHLLITRKLEAFVYQISYAIDKNKNDLLKSTLNKHDQNIEMLHSLGFNSPYADLKITSDINQVIRYCQDKESMRDTMLFEIDGAVVKVNDLSQCIKMGFTSHHPRWALAFKFKARQATTKILNIEFHVGKSGAITPVAKLEPVFVSGVTISSATLHNETFITEHDLRYGDSVLIERAGDVIPYIVKPIIESRHKNAKRIIFPSNCPACKSKLQKEEDAAVWKCVNINCPGQVLEKLIHFCYVMDIEGLGEKTISLFFKKGFIKKIPDIFNLPYNKIHKLEGFGDKSIINLKQAIESAKKRPINKLLSALSIRHIGENTALAITKSIVDISDLYNCNTNKLLKIKGIGAKAVNEVCNFFCIKENISTIEKLKSRGVNTSNKIQRTSVRKKLSGSTFVFTGKLNNYTRHEAKSIVEEMGGEVKEKISSDVTYLVVGKDPGSKVSKAKNKHTKILSEEDFKKLTLK